MVGSYGVGPGPIGFNIYLQSSIIHVSVRLWWDLLVNIPFKTKIFIQKKKKKKLFVLVKKEIIVQVLFFPKRTKIPKKKKKPNFLYLISQFINL